MKDEEKNTKKSSKKLIIVIAVIIVIAAIAFGLYSGIFPLPTGLMTAAVNGNQETTKTETQVPAQPTYTVTGITIIEKNISETLPYYEPIDLVSGRYMIYVTTDKPVWIRLYDEIHFDEWNNTGTHGQVVTGTNCCSESDKTQNLEQRFDVSIGYGGKHYLLILGGSEKTSINFKITQILKF